MLTSSFAWAQAQWPPSASTAVATNLYIAQAEDALRSYSLADAKWTGQQAGGTHVLGQITSFKVCILDSWHCVCMLAQWHWDAWPVILVATASMCRSLVESFLCHL